MKKIIVYYPFPLRDPKSGSAVRPLKMLEAFNELKKLEGIEIVEISGNSWVRKEKLKQLYNFTDPNDILFCYMENATLPFFLTDKDHIPRTPLMEINFFRYLYKNSIPLGLFYRDIYWKFKNEYPLKGLKYFIMRVIFSIELFIYRRYVHIFFLPSIYMNKHVGLNQSRVVSLPPGGRDLLDYSGNEKEQNLPLNVIYVGGISERYGLSNMLLAMKKLNKETITVKLLLVCREEEYDKYRSSIEPYLAESWLRIFHAFGDQLLPIYKKADIGIIPIKKNVYNDFAVPVKLFEYISFGLPVVATDCLAQANIINESNLGIVTGEDSDSLADGIQQFLDKSILSEYELNVRNALMERHLWQYRAKVVLSEMLKNRN